MHFSRRQYRNSTFSSYAIFTLTQNSEIQSSSSSLSDTGFEFTLRYAREMQDGEQWNADMEEYNAYMGGTNGSEDSEIH